MITNFEEFTNSLNEEEIKVANAMAIAFKKNVVGKEKAIKGERIARELYEKGFTKEVFPDVRIRKIINYIRINGLVPCLLSSSNGYYVAKNAKESAECIKSLKERVDAQIATLKVLAEQHKMTFSDNNITNSDSSIDKDSSTNRDLF